MERGEIEGRSRGDRGEIEGGSRGDRGEIARQVVLGLGQTVCGFDLLRSNGVSYCCDVNGFSFVKDSERF